MLRYEQRYPNGLNIRRNKTPLQLSYHAASASFSGNVKLDVGELPDVSRLAGPVRRLQDLAQAVTDELDPYSRWVGRYDGDRESLAALSLLPSDISENRQSDDLQDLLDQLEGALGNSDRVVVDVAILATAWPSKAVGKLTAREAGALTELLERYSYGVAPDIRYCGVNFASHRSAVVFRLPREVSEPGNDYRAATVLLHLGAAVSAADGTVTAEEERRLESHLEQSLHLPDADRRRLRAYLHWLLAEPPRMVGMKARVAALDQSLRQLIGRFALTVASADGHVSPQEIKALSSIYALLELENESLHSELHVLLSEPSEGPVTVVSADEDVGYRIPPPPADAVDEPEPAVRLDLNRVAEVMASTREVTQLLTQIFEEPSDDEPEEPVEIEEEEEDLLSRGNSVIAGLDSVHSELVRYLGQKPIWARSEIEELVGRLGLMLAGAIETINHAAFDSCDEPLIEGDDPLEVNEEALKELLNDH